MEDAHPAWLGEQTLSSCLTSHVCRTDQASLSCLTSCSACRPLTSALDSDIVWTCSATSKSFFPFVPFAPLCLLSIPPSYSPHTHIYNGIHSWTLPVFLLGYFDDIIILIVVVVVVFEVVSGIAAADDIVTQSFQTVPSLLASALHAPHKSR